MNRNTNRTGAATFRPGRFVARLAAAGLAVAAPLAIAGAAFSGPAQATTVPSYAFTLSSHSVAFGSVNTGASLANAVTLTNIGSKALQPVQILSGSPAITLNGGSCVNATVAPAGKCTYTLAFAPTAAGTASASLQVLTLQGTPVQTVAASGTGVVQLMESYNYLYTYTNPPVINGVAAPQSFQGTGFAPAGTYTMGQSIPVYDTAGLNVIGTYRIGATATVPLNAAQLNTVAVNVYTWGTTRYINGTGLAARTGTTGLGSEGGNVNGNTFSDQFAAIHPSHW
jgi:hypothetical protein